ncbi:Hypothetical predicted protein [Podarcis lilfordi]|uniref:Uncharacterized protein n=1 Tax=Podarcis lilfordi TaxID=74358 RepID=A0AA35L9G9_9SAUR|nr:Hypothetical predicted protein [Podarcis lilfordi]
MVIGPAAMQIRIGGRLTVRRPRRELRWGAGANRGSAASKCRIGRGRYFLPPHVIFSGGIMHSGVNIALFIRRIGDDSIQRRKQETVNLTQI